MVAFKDGPGKIVKVASTRFALVLLSMFLRLVMTIFDDVFAAAKSAPHTLWPAQLANFLITLRIIDEVLDIDQSHAGRILGAHVWFLRVVLPNETYGIRPIVSSGTISLLSLVTPTRNA